MSALRVFCWVVQRKLHDAVGRGHSQTTSRCKRDKCGKIPTEQSIAARIATASTTRQGSGSCAAGRPLPY